MKRRLVLFLVCIVALSVLTANVSAATSVGEFLGGVKTAIQKHLGRPYVWGATGMKSFDCSGFVWRVLYDNGILMKRTTARKFYMMMKPVTKEEQWEFGTLVFFDNLKHVGIIDSPDTFYHAQSSIGTNRSQMNTFWKKKIYGFRRLPLPEE
jgi:cell wall-associated NlpC family hydrolase